MAKSKDLILRGFTLRAAVWFSETSATQGIVKQNLCKQLGLDRVFDRDLSSVNVGPAVSPSRATKQP